MDKNTITGLVLIAILLVGFSFLSRPSKEQLAAQQRYYDSIAQVQQREADLKAKAEAALANDKEEQTADSTALFFNALQGTDSQVTIQNNLAELTVATKGGRISSATLKEYMGCRSSLFTLEPLMKNVPRKPRCSNCGAASV